MESTLQRRRSCWQATGKGEMSATDATPAKSRIFISYRREDAEYPVGRLTEDLRKHFPRDQVFQDIASIDPGADFVEALQQALDTCAAVLVVIGPSWLTLADHQGRRRLDLSDDWVRHEIAESLRRPGVRVFPLLLDAEMPSAEDLPEDIRPLTRRQAFPLTGRHWAKDVADLVEFLKKMPVLATTPALDEQVPQKALTQSLVPWKIVATLGVLLAIAILVFVVRAPPHDTIGDLNAKLGPIHEFCTKAITGRYPFARPSDKDVLPEDFARLFAPGGLFDNFVQQDLLKHVDTGARPWTWRQTGGRAGATTEGLRQLERAQGVRNAFFEEAGNRRNLWFNFVPIQMDNSITEFIIYVDGQIVRYAHGPSVPTPVQWPGPRGIGEVRVQVSPPSSGGVSLLAFSGPWALFRMFDRTRVDTTPQPEKFKVTFSVGERQATFEVTTSSVYNPFRLSDLERFECPARL